MVCPHGRAIHHDHIDVVGVGHRLHDPIPVARIAPTIEAVVDRGRRTVLLGQIGPGDARARDVKDAIDHAAIISTLHAA